MRMAPTPTEMRAVVSSSRRENTQSGSIGSAARLSAKTNATSSRPPMTKAPMLCTELHVQAWPPSSTARISRLSDTVKRTAPR